MNTQEFLTRIGNIFTRAEDILQSKNADYATDADPFLNFRGAVNIGITMEQGILVRMCDKFARLQNIIGRDTGPAVASETAEDTLLDIINYAAILLVALEEHKPTEPKTMREILKIVDTSPKHWKEQRGLPPGYPKCNCECPCSDLCPYWPGYKHKPCVWPSPVRIIPKITI